MRYIDRRLHTSKIRENAAWLNWLCILHLGVLMTCSPEQIRILLKYAHIHTQEIAAAKAGMSLSTAKRILKMGGKRKQREKRPRKGRTRLDPFADVWLEVKQLLEREPALEAKTLMEYLLGTYPGKFSEGQVRTLRRRVRDWRILEGPERKEVMFLQDIHPGRQSQSDYTNCNSLNITIDGKPFPHLLYHFMLPYSRWEFVWVCFTESIETLSTGYAMAVSMLGAVAPDHRTDNLAAAVPIGEHGSFQIRWTSFLDHYGVEPSSNNPKRSNENGSVEKSHDLFKHALDQRLLLRGSRDFKTLDEYEAYINSMARERNKLRKERLTEELTHLKPLPPNSWNEPVKTSASVTAWSTVRIASGTYSVPSRFIGVRLTALEYFDTVEVYYGVHLVLSAEKKPPGGKCINYRHLIFHLLRKPGAFRNYQFREELFPRIVFRQAYDRLLENDDERADKEYLHILHQAAAGSENEVAIALQILLEQNELPTSEKVKQLCCPMPAAVPKVKVLQPSLAKYDNLLKFRRTDKGGIDEHLDTTS